MLSELHVKNLALIEKADIEFGEGLNILTGETGAGKSIIIGSVTMALGGTGVISVASNIVPKDYHDLCAAMLKGDLEAAKKVHFKVAELCRVCFVETNPVPVKTAVALMGKMAADVRLPLVSLQPKSEEIVKAALKNLKLV